MRGVAMAQQTVNPTIGGTPGTTGPALQLCVFATTHRGTAVALKAARDLSLGLNSRVTLLVPVPVPYPHPVDSPATSVAFVTDRYRRLAEEAHIDVLVHVFVCRPEAADLQRSIPPTATVLVGGRTCRWWRTREERLARRLTAHGHTVLFISTDHQPWHRRRY